MKETKQEAAREKVTETELEVDQEEAAAAKEDSTTDPRCLQSHPQINKDHFLVSGFQELINKWGVIKIAAKYAVRSCRSSHNCGSTQHYQTKLHFLN